MGKFPCIYSGPGLHSCCLCGQCLHLPYNIGEDGVAAVIHCVSVQLGRAAFNIAELELVVVKLLVVVVVVVVRKLSP